MFVFSYSHRETVKHGIPESVATFGVIAGLWLAFVSLGNGIGSIVGGVIVKAFGFAWASLLVVVLQLADFILILFALIVTKRKTSKGYVELTSSQEDEEECPED